VVSWTIYDSLETADARRQHAGSREMASNAGQLESGLVHDTDRGVQYASGDCQKLLDVTDVIGWMPQRGCSDRATGESFLSPVSEPGGVRAQIISWSDGGMKRVR